MRLFERKIGRTTARGSEKRACSDQAANSRPGVTQVATISMAVLVTLPTCGDSRLSNTSDPSSLAQALHGEEADAADPALGSDVARPRVLKSLELSPKEPAILIDLGKTATRSFKVIARYADRSVADVSSRAVFTLDDASLGSMTGSQFESVSRSTPQVQFVNLTATYREGSVELSQTTQLVLVFLRTSGSSQDVFVKLPYGGGTMSTTISSGSRVQSIDAFFAVDTTGSMGPQINSIRSGLASTVLPAVRAAAARDAWFGVGAIDDFPSGSYGSPGCNGGPDDQPLILLQAMTPDLLKTQTAVGNLLKGTSPRGCGGDSPEGQMEALYQIATGVGNVVSGVVDIPPYTGMGRGGAGFRSGAMPVIAVVSDASFHTKGESTRTCFGATLDYAGATATAAHTRSQTLSGLKNLCARVVGVSTMAGTEEGCMATYDLQSFANGTGALVPPQAWDAAPGGRPVGCAVGQCCTGIGSVGEPPNAEGMCPLVLKTKSDGTGVGAAVASGITQLVQFAPFDVETRKSGGTTSEDGTRLPGTRTTADFISAVRPIDGLAPSSPAGLKNPTAFGDRFLGVTPGSSMRFVIDAKNDFAPPTGKPQIYRAKLRVQAQGCIDLDERDVIFYVPSM